MANTDETTAPRGNAVSNTEDVYTHLREALLNGEIAPGTVLSQVKLARELGVSTTPLREAMRLLQAEGLLTAEHNRRSRVAPLDPKDIDAVYASRILFEALAIRLTVPGMTTADHQALRADLEAMREAGDAQDLRAWEPVHRDFHRRLLHGSASMERIIDPILDRSERYRRSSLFGSPARTWELGNDEHEAIVGACEARDPQGAAALLARHLARSALTVLAKIAPEEDPVAVRAALDLVRRSATATAEA
jgi:DNA-binding GntR family transcriptional regulator